MNNLAEENIGERLVTGLERRQEATRNSLERCIDWPERYDKMRDVRGDNVTFKLTPLPQQATRFECHITIASVTVDQCCCQNSLPNSCLFIKIPAAIDETFQHRRSYLIFPHSSFFLFRSFYFLSYYFSSAFFPPIFVSRGYLPLTRPPDEIESRAP